MTRFRRRPLIRKKRIIPRHRSPFRKGSFRSVASSRAAAHTRAIERRLWRDYDMMGVIMLVMLFISLLVGAFKFSAALGVVLIGYRAITSGSRGEVVEETGRELTDDERRLAEWDAFTEKRDGYNSKTLQKAMRKQVNNK